MSKAPKKAKAPKANGRPSKGVVEKTLVRFPPDVKAGLVAKVAADGLASLNEGIVAGVAKWAGVRYAPAIKPSAASQVQTSTRPPETPGSRLDKKATAARHGPKIVKTPVPVASVEEEAV